MASSLTQKGSKDEFQRHIILTQILGFTGSILLAEYATGFTFSMLLGALFPWQTVTLIAAFIPAVCFVFMIFVRESPSWLLRYSRQCS